jgi:hypothetical protein
MSTNLLQENEEKITDYEKWTGVKFKPPSYLSSEAAATTTTNPRTSIPSSNNKIISISSTNVPTAINDSTMNSQQDSMFDDMDDIDFLNELAHFESNINLVQNFGLSPPSSQQNSMIESTTKSIASVSIKEQTNTFGGSIPSSVREESIEIENTMNAIKALKSELNSSNKNTNRTEATNVSSVIAATDSSSKIVQNREDTRSKSPFQQQQQPVAELITSSSSVTTSSKSRISSFRIEEERESDDDDAESKLITKINQEYLLKEDANLQAQENDKSAEKVTSNVPASLKVNDKEEVIDLSTTKHSYSTIESKETNTENKLTKKKKKEKKEKKEKKVKKHKKEKKTKKIDIPSNSKMIDITEDEEVPPISHVSKSKKNKKKKGKLSRNEFIDYEAGVKKKGSDSERDDSDEIGLDTEDKVFRRLKKNSPPRQDKPISSDEDESDEDEWDSSDPFIVNTSEEEEEDSQESEDEDNRSKSKHKFHKNPYMDTRKSIKGLEHIPVIYEHAVKKSDEVVDISDDEEDEDYKEEEEEDSGTTVPTDTVDKMDEDDDDKLNVQILSNMEIMDVDKSLSDNNNNLNNNDNLNKDIVKSLSKTEEEEEETDAMMSSTEKTNGVSELCNIHELIFRKDDEFKKYFNPIFDKLLNNTLIEPIIKNKPKPIQNMIKIVLIYAYEVVVKKSHEKLISKLDSRSIPEDSDNVKRMTEMRQEWELHDNDLLRKLHNKFWGGMNPVLQSILYHICASSFEGLYYEKTTMDYSEDEDDGTSRCAITNKKLEQGEPVFLVGMCYSMADNNVYISSDTLAKMKQLKSPSDSDDKSQHTRDAYGSELLKDMFYVCCGKNRPESFINAIKTLINFKCYKKVLIYRISEWKKSNFPSVDASSGGSGTNTNSNNNSFGISNKESDSSQNMTQHEITITSTFAKDFSFIEELVLNYFMLKILVLTKICGRSEENSD